MNDDISILTLALAKKYTDEHGGGGGTTDYDDLSNKPQIAGITLSGNKSLADLGIASATDLADKVDKVAGKVLSTNDYTDADKTIVAGVTTALAGKQDTLTFDDTPTDNSNNPVKSNGIYDALALKQNATDNSLATDAKTIVGAINEHEGDVASLKSGLTTLDNEVNGDATVYPYADVITIPDAVPANLADCTVKIEPVQDLHGYDKPWVGGAGKNKLHTTATTTTQDDVTYTVNSDGTISVSGTASGVASLTITTDTEIDITKAYILSGLQESNNIVWNTAVLLDNSQTQLKSYSLVGRNDITFDDFDEYPTAKYLKVSIKRYQNGVVSGIIKPMLRLSTETDATFAPYTNICPISGHTEASVQRDGKNFAKNNMSTTTSSGVTWTKNSDGSISVSGTPTGNTSVNDAFIAKVSSEYGNVTFSGLNGVTNIVCEVLRLKDSNGVTIQSFLPGASDLTIDLSNYNDVDYITATYKRAANNVACSGTIKPQIEIGKTATAFVPYAGKTYTIALGDTIYGGTVDFDSGVMTVDRKTIIFDGTENWSQAPSPRDKSFLLNGDLGIEPVWGSTLSNGIANYLTANDVNAYAGRGYCYAYSNNNFYVSYVSATDLADFKSILSSNNLQIVAKLITPTTIQLTPQQIQLLKGTNTLTASTGDISVTVNGVSGSIGAVQEQVNEIAEDVADVQSGLANLSSIQIYTNDADLIADLYNKNIGFKCVALIDNTKTMSVLNAIDKTSTYLVLMGSSDIWNNHPDFIAHTQDSMWTGHLTITSSDISVTKIKEVQMVTSV